VSSLWTPDGERPVGRPGDPPAGTPPGAPPDPFDGPEDRIDDDALAAQVEAMRAELAEAPVDVVVANHCYALFELAALHLSQQPPHLDQARLAIDALGCLVDGLEGRLGEGESVLKEGRASLQLAWVQIDGAQRAGAQVDAVVGVDPDASPADDDSEDGG
jgi:hypothetical protein